MQSLNVQKLVLLDPIILDFCPSRVYFVTVILTFVLPVFILCAYSTLFTVLFVQCFNIFFLSTFRHNLFRFG